MAPIYIFQEEAAQQWWRAGWMCVPAPGAWWLATESGFGILGFQGLGVFPSRIRVAKAPAHLSDNYIAFISQ